MCFMNDSAHGIKLDRPSFDPLEDWMLPPKALGTRCFAPSNCIAQGRLPFKLMKAGLAETTNNHDLALAILRLCEGGCIPVYLMSDRANSKSGNKERRRQMVRVEVHTLTPNVLNHRTAKSAAF
jgi:hypothetical protein